MEYTVIKPDPELKNNLMAFGFEHGAGWNSLTIELVNKIQEYVNSNPRYHDLEITQIKNKLGGLRVYMNYYPEEIERMIDDYENRSFHICELCGKTGELTKHRGWYQTLCQDCREDDSVIVTWNDTNVL